MIVAADGRTPLNGKPRTADMRRASDFATLGDVAAIAQILNEMAEKLARVEDQLGITDATVAGEQQTAGGDVE